MKISCVMGIFSVQISMRKVIMVGRRLDTWLTSGSDRVDWSCAWCLE